MKRLVIAIALAGLFVGCARHRESSQGAGGYYDNTGSSMGATTNSGGISPSQGGTSDQGTPQQGTKGNGTGNGNDTGSGNTPPPSGSP